MVAIVSSHLRRGVLVSRKFVPLTQGAYSATFPTGETATPAEDPPQVEAEERNLDGTFSIPGRQVRQPLDPRMSSSGAAEQQVRERLDHDAGWISM
jgi:hypothetical protein